MQGTKPLCTRSSRALGLITSCALALGAAPITVSADSASLSEGLAPQVSSQTLGGIDHTTLEAMRDSGAVQIAQQGDNAAAIRAQIDALLDEANDLRRDDEFDAALQKAQEIYQLDVDNAEAQQLIARIEREKAASQQRAAEERMERIDDMEREATSLFNRERFEDAIETARQIQAIDPQNSAARAIITQSEQGMAAMERAQASERAAEQQREQAAGLYDTAREQREDGDLQAALATASEAVRLDPDNRRYARLVNRINNDIAEAQADATRAERERAERIADLIADAERALERGRFDDAIEEATEVRQLDPNNADAQAIIVSAQQAIQFEQSAREAERLAERIADLERAAQRASDRGRHEQAQALAVELQGLDSDNAVAAQVTAAADAAAAAEAAAMASEQARIAAEQQAEQEREAAAQAAAMREAQADDLYDQARTLRSEGNLEAALAAAQEAARLEDSRRNTRLVDALSEDVAEAAEEANAMAARQAEQQTEMAARQAEEAAATQARQQEMAAQQVAQQTEQAAQQAAQQAEQAAAAQAAAAAQSAAQAEEQAAGLYDQARAQREAGNLEAALATAQQAAALQPDSGRYERLVGAISEDIADAQEEAMEAAARREARVADAVMDGQRALSRERYDDAVESFNEALALDPNSEAAKAGLAQVQSQLDAIAAAEAAAIAAAQDREANLAAAAAALENEQYIEAISIYETLVAADPDDRDATRGLRDATRAKERADEAAEEEARIASEQYEREQREKSVDLAEQADELLADGQIDAAERSYQEALQAWADNDDAQDGLEDVAQARADIAADEARRLEAEADALVDGLIQEGRRAYEQGDVIAAVERWNRVISLDPNNDVALVYLEETADEYAQAVEQRDTADMMAQRQQEMIDRLNTPITISTPPEGTPLQVFLNNIAVFTDLDFVIADGLEVNVTASFVEQPLSQVLEAVIAANGLRYSVEETVITIESDLKSRLFNLSPQDTASLKIFEESGSLDLMLYPPAGERSVQGMSYELDDVTGTFFITGSADQIARVEELIAGLTDVSREISTAFFVVREDQGERIKQLVEAILEAEATPWANAFDRRIILNGDNLIVRATADEILRVEQVLADIDQIEGVDDLEVSTFSLIPRQILFREDEETARQWANAVVETVEVLLYSQQGAEAARSEGRRLWYDQNTMQLTITDTKDNIVRVTRYVSSLPMLEPKRTTRIRYLDHQSASDIAGKLGDFLDIEIAGSTGGSTDSTSSGNSVTTTLREDDDFTFRDLRITLIGVEENEVNDDRDEQVELIIDTLTSSEEREIEELRSEIFDDYRIRIIEADADGNGGGKAEIEITWLGEGGGNGGGGGQTFQVAPRSATGGGGATDQTGTGEEGAAAEEEPTDDRVPRVIADDSTNSLLISVVNPGDLEVIEQAVDLLDIPILQAQIETKFVEVNENRARELKNEISLAGIGREGINFDDAFFGARYANDADEFRSIFEPSLESPVNANLPKGTTVLTLITGGETPMAWEMSFLEAEGVINTVNGPFITAQNNQSATFDIRQEFSNFGPIGGVSANNNNNNNNNDNNNNSGGNVGVVGSGASVPNIDLVQFDVTPSISHSGYMELQIDVQIHNFTNNLGQLVSSSGAIIGGNDGTGTGAIIPVVDQATSNVFGLFSSNYKDLDTTARVRDGGTIILGGWTLERVMQTSSGVPVLRNLPYIGQMLFSRNQDLLERMTLLIFLTSRIIEIE